MVSGFAVSSVLAAFGAGGDAAVVSAALFPQFTRSLGAAS